MAMDKQEKEDLLWARQRTIHERIQTLANREVKAALVGGYGANGELMAEKERLIEQSEATLDILEQLYEIKR